MLLSIILSYVVLAVPVQKPAQLNGVCGGFLGIQCVKGLECQYEVSSDPNTVISDAQGVCKSRTSDIRKPAQLNGVCGGFLGVQCAKGLECQYEVSSDPNTVISDAQGVCKSRASDIRKPAQLNGVCGGFLGVQCAKGLECQYEVSSDPDTVLNDAQGTCKKLKNTGTIKKRALLNEICGGFMGIECDADLTCKMPVNADPYVIINDEQGICAKF